MTLKAIYKKVLEQAEDEGIWFEADTATEAYLQMELRELHDLIEMSQKVESQRIEELELEVAELKQIILDWK